MEFNKVMTLSTQQEAELIVWS